MELEAPSAPAPPPYHPCHHPFQHGLVCGIALQRILPLLPHHALQGGDEVLSDSKGGWVLCVKMGVWEICKHLTA